MYKDFKGAETHPSGVEDEVLLPRPLLCQHECEFVYFCVCMCVGQSYYSILLHE